MDHFKYKNLNKILLDFLENSEYKTPTAFQNIFIPESLKKNDLIGISSTGSGKTISFVLPIISSLLTKNTFNHSLVVVPTRELAIQVNNVFLDIGIEFGLRTCLLIGGDDFKIQKAALQKKPHIIIGTPGRIADHEFTLSKLKYLILDEADKLFEKNFQDDVSKIFGKIVGKKGKADVEKNYQTFLFSATLTNDIEDIAKSVIYNHKVIKLSSKPKILEGFVFLPHKSKIAYLNYILTTEDFNSCIIFVSACVSSKIISNTLNKLDINSTYLNGDMNQNERKECVKNFRNNINSVLVATDVASRGIDIPNVDLIINYDIPQPKTYVHRIGRTGRHEKSGSSITFVSQYDIITLQKIEHFRKSKIEKIECKIKEVSNDNERINKLFKEAYNEAKENAERLKNKKKKKFKKHEKN